MSAMNGGRPGIRFTNVSLTATDSAVSIFTTAYPIAAGEPFGIVTCAS